jgi:hypothetical protein
MFFPYADSKETSPVYALLKDNNTKFPCKIVHGNSGSPAFDDQNNLRAVLNSATFPPAPTLLAVFTQTAPVLPKNFQNAAFATSALCIPETSGSLSQLPKECDMLQNKALDKRLAMKKREEYNRIARDSLDAIAADWGQHEYPMFQWKMTEANVEIPFEKTVLIPGPLCSMKTGLSEAKYKGVVWTFKHSVQEEIALPTYRINTDVDNNLRLVFLPYQDDSVILRGNIEFNAQDIAEGQSTHFKLTYKSGFLGSEKTLLEGAVEPCPDPTKAPTVQQQL